MAQKKIIESVNKVEDKEKSTFGKIWHFLWKSNSIWSWIADLIILYIIVKFIFFPILSMAFGTALPSVIVESSSMHHTGDFDTWWQNYGWWYTANNITKEQAASWGFHKGIDKGDIVIVFGTKGNISIGDIIIFNAGERKPIIHRVVSLDPIETKGDNNQGQLNFEHLVNEKYIIGKATYRIPKVGWVKLVFVELLSSGK